jgi:hypothetical protein
MEELTLFLIQSIWYYDRLSFLPDFTGTTAAISKLELIGDDSWQRRMFVIQEPIDTGATY